MHLAVINDVFNESLNSDEDLTPLMTKQIKELRLYETRLHQCTLFASGELPHCPQFTHFIAEGLCINNSVPSAFMKAVKVGNLPNLKRIELNNCSLSDCQWPEVPEFSLKVRSTFDTSQMQKLLSNLTDLTLDGLHDHLISTRLTKLSVLKLEKATASSLLRLNDILRERKLPNLTELSVKGSSYEHRSELDSFLDELEPYHILKLAKVSLENFIISSQGLKLFCQKLPFYSYTSLI